MLKFKISKKGYTSTIFEINNNKIKFQNMDITGSQFLDYPKSLEDLLKHVENLKQENFKMEMI